MTDAWEILLIYPRCQMLLLDRWIYECAMKTFKVLWNDIQHITTWSSARWWLTSVTTHCLSSDSFALFAKGFPATKRKYVYCADRYHEKHYCVCVPFEIMLFIMNSLPWRALEDRNRLNTAPWSKDENGKEISRTEPHRFLHLTRANSYFRTKYGILNSNSKYEILNSKSDRIQFRLCSTDFYFSTFYSESSVF